MAIVTVEISAVAIGTVCSNCNGERQCGNGSLDGSIGSVGSTRDGSSG
jgi:hypothetical protein